LILVLIGFVVGSGIGGLIGFDFYGSGWLRREERRRQKKKNEMQKKLGID